MKSRVFFPLLLVPALVGALSLRAVVPETDNPGKRADIGILPVLTGSRDLALQTVERMFDRFKRTMPQVPGDFWKDAAAEIRTRTDDLPELRIPICEKHLAHDDMEWLIEFYESPAGKKFVKSQPAIRMECMQVGRKWGQKIGEKVMKKLQQQGKL